MKDQSKMTDGVRYNNLVLLLLNTRISVITIKTDRLKYFCLMRGTESRLSSSVAKTLCLTKLKKKVFEGNKVELNYREKTQSLFLMSCPTLSTQPLYFGSDFSPIIQTGDVRICKQNVRNGQGYIKEK